MKRAALLALVALLFGCQEQLTPDGPQYRISTDSAGTLQITNTVSGGNDRELFWPLTQASSATATECATWRHGPSNAQNGLAFRIQPADGGWDTVVLERNVWANEYWDFVLVYFHTGRSHSRTFDTSTVVDLGDYLGRSRQSAVYPLSICASTTGSTLSFAVAKAGDAMPALGSAGHGATLHLDARKTPPNGYTGTYVAHLAKGKTTTITGIDVDGTQMRPPT